MVQIHIVFLIIVYEIKENFKHKPYKLIYLITDKVTIIGNVNESFKAEYLTCAKQSLSFTI